MTKPLPHHHQENEQEIIEHIPNPETIETVAAAMKQLGDPTRLRIFWFLCHAQECVINIAAAVDMSSPAVSHHLRLLKDARLITSERHGKEMYYQAAESELVNTLHHVIEKVAKVSCPSHET